MTNGEPETVVSASLQKIKSIKNPIKHFFFIFFFIKSETSDSFVNHFDGHFAYLKTLDFYFNTFACTICFASPSFASRMKAVVVVMLAYVSGVPFPQLKFPLGITSSRSPPLPHRLKKKKKKKIFQLTLYHCADGLETFSTVQPIIVTDT